MHIGVAGGQSSAVGVNTYPTQQRGDSHAGKTADAGCEGAGHIQNVLPLLFGVEAFRSGTFQGFTVNDRSVIIQ